MRNLPPLLDADYREWKTQYRNTIDTVYTDYVHQTGDEMGFRLFTKFFYNSIWCSTSLHLAYAAGYQDSPNFKLLSYFLQISKRNGDWE